MFRDPALAYAHARSAPMELGYLHSINPYDISAVAQTICVNAQMCPLLPTSVLEALGLMSV
jgi:hypothetical protein